MDPFVLKKIFETIFYYIHEAPRLRRLFIRWSFLDRNDRGHIDNILQTELQDKQLQLYNTLRDALQAWEHLQDTQGAPGFQPGTVQYNCDDDIEQDLTYIMSLLENCIDKVYDDKNLTASAGNKNVELSEEVPIRFSMRYLSPNECESDYRLSRSLFKQKQCGLRARSTSANRKRQLNFRKEISVTKSCTNFVKTTERRSCGYRSE